MKRLILAAALATGMLQAAHADDALKAAIASTERSPANVARDPARHPYETLTFFGIKPTMTVVELAPGGGWYTEVLAPYLASGGGTLYAVAPGWGMSGIVKLKAANPALYGSIRTADFPAFDAQATRVPAGSADVVLTFRNIHNLRFSGVDRTQAAFAEMFRMLKPGGTLGIVEHRLPEARDAAAEEKSGYMKVSSVVGFARKAGFEVAGMSEVNANPKDTADYADGVWTLPPSYARKDVDRAKYAAIGESDRMTIRFIKPKR